MKNVKRKYHSARKSSPANTIITVKAQDRAAGRSRPLRVLAIDIGGTGIKAAIVGPDGKFLSRPVRVKTPKPRPPCAIVAALVGLAQSFRRYDCIAMGFPGYVRDGVVRTAPHFGTKDWAGFALAEIISRKLGKPVRLVNDADMQGLAVIKGNGLELMITLGTGFGTAWFRDGELMPHIELAHIPIHGKRDFDAYLGDAERKKIGNRKWRMRLERIIPVLRTVLNYDHLYLGGGNARHVKFKLPPDVSKVSNDAGMEGGAWLWHAHTRSR